MYETLRSDEDVLGLLRAAFEGDVDEVVELLPEPGTTSVLTFADAGIMCLNDGLVVRLPNGAEFQIQLVQSKPGRAG